MCRYAAARDEKGLSAETEAMRAAVEERHQVEKQLQAAKLMEENQTIKARLDAARG